MNNIELIFQRSGNFEQFAKEYFNYISGCLKQLDTKAIEAFIEELEHARNNESTVFLAGNGGSAATACHMANDIAIDVLKKGGSGKPFRILALANDVPVMTAIANDDGYENLFVNQLRIHYRPGDKLAVISASGNSPNVVAAAEWVSKRGGKVIGLLGFDGGKLKDICDIVIHVNTKYGEYGPVEDIHMIIDHLVSNWLINRLKTREK